MERNAAEYTISAIQEAHFLEKQNSIHKEDMNNNLGSIYGLEHALPEIRDLQSTLRSTRQQIREKQNEIIQLQHKLITQLTKSQQPPSDQFTASITSAETLTRIQEHIFHLTESLADKKQTQVPLSDIIQLAHSLNDIFDDLLQSGSISETPQERELRHANLSSIYSLSQTTNDVQ